MATPTESLSSTRLRLLSALGFRDYRLFFIGQTVSQTGSWMQATALPWLVYDSTGSSWLLGVIGASTYLPLFLFGPVAGAVADRHDRRLILMATQTVSMIQALLLGVLTLTGVIETSGIIALALLASVATCFDMPAAAAFVSDLVPDPKVIPRAIALNAAMTNLTRMVAPAAAGLLISLVGSGHTGEGTCFLLNSASYLAVLGSLAALRTRPAIRTTKAAPLTTDLMEGFRYALGFAPMRDLLLLASLVGLLGVPATLVPVIAKKLGEGDASTYGFLTGAAGAGALTGALFVATRRDQSNAGRRIVVGVAGLGLSLIAFALTTSLAAALLCRFLGGVFLMVQTTTGTSLMQLLADPDKRGRVLSLFSMAFLGMAALGNLAAGALAGVIGAENTLIVDGCGCLVGALVFALTAPALGTHLRATPASEEGHLPMTHHGAG